MVFPGLIRQPVAEIRMCQAYHGTHAIRHVEFFEVYKTYKEKLIREVAEEYNNQIPNKNGTLLPIPFSRNKIVSIEAKFNKSIQEVYEIYISNYNGVDKGISAREVLITNGKGELIYTDSIARGSALHIEKTQNGIFVPIKRILVNRKNTTPKGINQIQLIQRVNSIEAIRKNGRVFAENKNELKIIKSKTLSLIKTKSKPVQGTTVSATYDKIKISFEANHGHLHHIGLTGIIQNKILLPKTNVNFIQLVLFFKIKS